jgi:uncharacterized protein YneF (UPF0154 family)
MNRRGSFIGGLLTFILGIIIGTFFGDKLFILIRGWLHI